MKEIDALVAKLEAKSEVDAVFLTGSFGRSKESGASDIDMVIILKDNRAKIKSVYQIIDGAFADIFFFDHKDIRKVLAVEKMDGNSMDGILISWLLRAKILFDKSGLITKTKGHTRRVLLFVSEKERKDIIQKISYNYFQNTRYYNSSDALYRDALEIRLLYSITELITGFLTLHGEPWRGEKHAIAFMKTKDKYFYETFLEYQTSSNLKLRMEAYEKMMAAIKYLFPLLDYHQPVYNSIREDSNNTEKKLKEYWRELIT